MEQIILKSIRIINWLIGILLGLLCIPAFFLFIYILLEDLPTKLDTFFHLTVPFIILAIFLSIRIKLKKKGNLSDFSKLDCFLCPF